MIESSEPLDLLGAALMVVGIAAFIVIAVWTFLRPKARIEADAQLWKDDE